MTIRELLEKIQQENISLDTILVLSDGDNFFEEMKIEIYYNEDTGEPAVILRLVDKEILKEEVK